MIAVALTIYITLAYISLNHFKFNKTFLCIRNILPAAMTGFSTMSSAAAMPFTIAGAKRNAHYKELAGSVIPATVNIHLVGDCFAIPILRLRCHEKLWRRRTVFI